MTPVTPPFTIQTLVTAHTDPYFPAYTSQDQAGKVDSIEEMVRMVVEMLSRKPESEEASSVGFSWVEAAEAGLGDKRCDQIFTECQDLDFKQNLLQLSF